MVSDRQSMHMGVEDPSRTGIGVGMSTVLYSTRTGGSGGRYCEVSNLVLLVLQVLSSSGR